MQPGPRDRARPPGKTASHRPAYPKTKAESSVLSATNPALPRPPPNKTRPWVRGRHEHGQVTSFNPRTRSQVRVHLSPLGESLGCILHRRIKKTGILKRNIAEVNAKRGRR